ncbi:MAG: HPr family phosphocarrier protein [Proteobacteria bacterium]|nr:HPr family phosphocarrier protein [Pseudomonadota bacterium]
MSAPAKAPRKRPARRSVVIVNRLGLHARAAARFVKTARAFDAEVTVTRRSAPGAGQRVSGHSIMGLMTLAAGPGVRLSLGAEGPDAEAALDALCRLVEDRFEEEE